MGSRPPQAFLGLSPPEREELYWQLKAASTLMEGAGPGIYGPATHNSPPPTQQRQPRRARVLTREQRDARLACRDAEMSDGQQTVSTTSCSSFDA